MSDYHHTLAVLNDSDFLPTMAYHLADDPEAQIVVLLPDGSHRVVARDDLDYDEEARAYVLDLRSPPGSSAT